MHTNTRVFHRPGTTAAVVSDLLSEDYLVFRLANRQYAVGLHKVHELRGHDTAHGPIAPTATDTVAAGIGPDGVGSAVVNLDVILGMGATTHDCKTDIVVLHSAGRFAAIAVDCVIDVVTLTPEQVRTGPKILAADRTSYVAGVGMIDQRVLTLLDTDRLIADLLPSGSATLAT